MRIISKYQIKHKVIAGLAALLLALFPYTALALEAISIESNTPVETELFGGDTIEYTIVINELQYASGGVWLRVELADGVEIESESVISGISAETALPALPGEEVDDELEESPLSVITHSITPGNNGFIVLANAIAPGDYIDFRARVSDAGDIQVTVFTEAAEVSLSHVRGVIAPPPTPEPPAEEVFEPEIQKNNGVNIAALIIFTLLFAFIIYLLIRKLSTINLIRTKRANGKSDENALTPHKENNGGRKNDTHGEDSTLAKTNNGYADSHADGDSPDSKVDGINPDDSVGI